MSPKMRDLIISTFLSVFLGLAVSGLMMLFLGADPLSVFGRLLQVLVRDKYTFADIFVKNQWINTVIMRKKGNVGILENVIGK